jgi:uncharacterized protein Usg
MLAGPIEIAFHLPVHFGCEIENGCGDARTPSSRYRLLAAILVGHFTVLQLYDTPDAAIASCHEALSSRYRRCMDRHDARPFMLETPIARPEATSMSSAGTGAPSADDLTRPAHWLTASLGDIRTRLGLPDHPAPLQTFIWQAYDIAPAFPKLQGFLNYWGRELDGPLHSVRVAHQRLIKPSEWRAVDGIIRVH